jgi:NAD dependent epimerase/dehydratase family
MTTFLRGWMAFDVVSIGRTVDPGLCVDAVLHLAAPNHRDEAAIEEFRTFNDDLLLWTLATGTPVVNCGSWWQYAAGEPQELAYTKMKHEQQEMFGRMSLIPYSVYGSRARDDRGFVPQLIGHRLGRARLAGASRQARDWIHVLDVCRAFVAALYVPPGVYAVCTRDPISPYDLAFEVTGERLPDYAEHPACLPSYPLPSVPSWTPSIDVVSFIVGAK